MMPWTMKVTITIDVARMATQIIMISGPLSKIISMSVCPSAALLLPEQSGGSRRGERRDEKRAKRYRRRWGFVIRERRGGRGVGITTTRLQLLRDDQVFVGLAECIGLFLRQRN